MLYFVWTTEPTMSVCWQEHLATEVVGFDLIMQRHRRHAPSQGRR